MAFYLACMAGFCFCFVLQFFIERTRETGEGEGLLSLFSPLVRARVFEISPLVSYYREKRRLNSYLP